MNKKDLFNSKMFITDPNIKRLVLSKLAALGFYIPTDHKGNCIYITSTGMVLIDNGANLYPDYDYTEVYPPEIIGMTINFQESFLDQMKKHSPFGWVKNKNNGKLYSLSLIDDRSVSFGYNGKSIGYKDLKENYIFADNFPIF